MISYSSSNSKIVTVNSKGILTAKKKGTAFPVLWDLMKKRPRRCIWLDTYFVEQIDACFGTGHIFNSVWIKECYRDGIQ